MTPTVADNRTCNLLILLAPASELPSVTAEVASSSLVVPAILSQELTEAASFSRGTDRKSGTAIRAAPQSDYRELEQAGHAPALGTERH